MFLTARFLESYSCDCVHIILWELKSSWGLSALKIIGFYQVNFSSTFLPKVQYWPFQTNKSWGCGTTEEAPNSKSGDQGSSLSFVPNKLCGLGPVFPFQISISSRKTWVRTAFIIGDDLLFAEFLISMLQNERELTERYQQAKDVMMRKTNKQTTLYFLQPNKRSPGYHSSLVSVQRQP